MSCRLYFYHYLCTDKTIQATMDQLFNFQPPIDDPNDPRTYEEKMRDGCLGVTLSLVVLVALLCFAMCLTSCSVSKSSCGVTIADADSLNVYIEQTSSVSRKDTTTAQSATVFNSSAAETTTADETETETISEQITETTDSLGNRTTTTNRTTTRQRKTNTATQSLLDQYRQEIALQMQLSYLDSILNAQTLATHVHQTDSTATKEEKFSDAVYAKVISVIVDWIFRVIGLLVLAVVVYITAKYIRCK